MEKQKQMLNELLQEEKRVLILTTAEDHLTIRGLLQFRNKQIEQMGGALSSVLYILGEYPMIILDGKKLQPVIHPRLLHQHEIRNNHPPQRFLLQGLLLP